MNSPSELDTVLIDSFELPLITWKTPWYQCDTESCIMSLCLPCHIHSKIMINVRSNYKLYFAVSFMFYLFYYTTIFGMFYIPSLTCDGELTDTCMYQTQNLCNQLYVLVNIDKTYQCKWVGFLDTCIPETNIICLRKDIVNGNMSIIITFFCIFTLIYAYFKVQFREVYQSNNHIPRKKWDYLISLCCPICSDAQLYREETIQNQSFITV